ncbi:hypothetical protein [Candidatus Mycoplasma haematohominis]|uniref:hypothetical protein n=1 Tax=Candidatus Mycoplasma haematohominis TaxID=1494318 RepID=UPI001C0A74E5|nr:hypothetical protein [Candidatus Mycoplasma haemohominis]
MDPTKLAVGTGVAVLAVGGGYGVSALFNGGMPGYSAREVNKSDKKYVDDYPDYFVDASSGANDGWWDWVFKNRYFDKEDSTSSKNPVPGSKFKGVKSGSKGSDSLKNKCKEVYLQDASKINNTVTDDANKYFEADAWRYCTAVNKKPTNIPDPTDNSEKYDSGTFGETYKGKLVAISPEDNKYFWDEQQRLFFENDGGRSGKKAEHKTFQDLLNKKTGSVKATCVSLYKQQTNANSDENFKKDLFKFCSLKGTEN